MRRAGNFFMKADTEKVWKLLTDEKVSRYRVWKDTGIAQSTLSDLTTGKVQIEDMKLGTAIKLTEYYENLNSGEDVTESEL